MDQQHVDLDLDAWTKRANAAHQEWQCTIEQIKNTVYVEWPVEKEATRDLYTKMCTTINTFNTLQQKNHAVGRLARRGTVEMHTQTAETEDAFHLERMSPISCFIM
jgi:hypothetical protein